MERRRRRGVVSADMIAFEWKLIECWMSFEEKEGCSKEGRKEGE